MGRVLLHLNLIPFRFLRKFKCTCQQFLWNGKERAGSQTTDSCNWNRVQIGREHLMNTDFFGNIEETSINSPNAIFFGNKSNALTLDRLDAIQSGTLWKFEIFWQVKGTKSRSSSGASLQRALDRILLLKSIPPTQKW